MNYTISYYLALATDYNGPKYHIDEVSGSASASLQYLEQGNHINRIVIGQSMAMHRDNSRQTNR